MSVRPDLPIRHPELAGEQNYVDAAYARLDAMRRSAVSVAEAFDEVRRGGTHQARLERDVAITHTQRRLAALDIGDSALVFGRLDLDGGDRCYVGRLGVDTEDHTQLVVDWRAPIAEPFYRATALQRMGVVRRRHFQTRGRQLLGLDDEVFDQEATSAAGLELVGEGALLAALDRDRTGRMHDIVATIQAEQDEAIRADLQGVLVVTGGPGTGKTAVALHRAAYLLYTHRRQLGSRGVLLVGPNSLFLRYIDEVLPSLGEDEVQLTTLRGLKPGFRALGTEDETVAAVKGDGRMAAVIAKAVRDRQRALPRDLVVDLDGHRLRVTRRDSARVVSRVRSKRGTHNERRPIVERMLIDHLANQYRRSLVRAYHRSAPDRPNPTTQPFAGLDQVLSSADVPVAAALARGMRVSEEWERELTRRIRRHATTREVLERIWPVLSGAELVHDLFSFEGLIRSAADPVLSRFEQQGLYRARSSHVRHVIWTESDLPLIDEADAILGSPEAARPGQTRGARRAEQHALDTAARVVDELGLAGVTTPSELAERYGAGAAARAGDDGDSDPRRFGHVLVDEAQDLSAMQWRVLARRCPSGSMTIVGDFGQASRPGALSGWDEVLTHLPTRVPGHTITLSVNYRTPEEIMSVANRVLAVAAPGVRPARAVRSTGNQPVLVKADVGALVEVTASEVRRTRLKTGTVTVVAPRALHDPLVAELADLGASAQGPEALDAAVSVIDAADAKGLEFDHVIVVEPADLVAPDMFGLRALYVALTRATQTLTVVHEAPLPASLVLRDT